MSTKLNWQPTRAQIDWTRALIENSNRDYTLWTVPANMSTYLINRTRKTFTLVNGPELWYGNISLFDQLGTVLPKLGFTVERLHPGTIIPENVKEIIRHSQVNAGGAQTAITVQMAEDMTGKGKTNQIIHTTTSTGTNS